MEKVKNPWVSFDKLTKFEQYMLTKDGINIDEIESLYLTSEILSRYHIYVLIDLVTDMQLTLYKGYLYNLYGKELTDEEVYSMASPAISKKIDYKSNILIPKNLPIEYGYRLAHDSALIKALKERGISVDLNELRKLFPNYKAMLYYCGEKSCIDNIILKNELNKIGLEDYSKTIITRLLGEEAYLTLGKDTLGYDDTIKSENLKISLSISKKKPNIKRLIKEHKKSTK